MAGFSEGMQAGHLIAQDSIDLFNTGYSVYQDQRNYDFSKDVFDYNKALQQEIFNREDTAYERKRRDLERAGLNPNLAAGGSGAAAGQVVGNSNQAGGHQLYKADLMRNYGAYLDAKLADEKLKQGELQTELLKEQSSSYFYQSQKNKQDAKMQSFYSAIENVFDSGLDPDKYVVLIAGGGGPAGFSLNYPVLDKVNNWSPEGLQGNIEGGYMVPLSKTRYWNQLLKGERLLNNSMALSDNDVYESNNSREMSDLQRQMLANDAEWQTSDKWINRVGRIIDHFTGAVNGVANMTRAVRPYKKNNPQLQRKSKTWTKNSSVETYEY